MWVSPVLSGVWLLRLDFVSVQNLTLLESESASQLARMGCCSLLQWFRLISWVRFSINILAGAALMALCSRGTNNTQPQTHKQAPFHFFLHCLHLYFTFFSHVCLLFASTWYLPGCRWDCFSGGCGYFTARGEHATPSHASSSSPS